MITVLINHFFIIEFDKWFGYFSDILGPIVALVGILCAIPILKKKLIETHITNALEKIHKANKESQAINQKIIDRYTIPSRKTEVLKKSDIETAYNDIREAFEIAQKGSSDIATFLRFLKTTLERTFLHYQDGKSAIILSKEFYSLINEILELVNFFSTQAVQIPKSSRLVKHELISKTVRKYLTHTKINKYKHFKTGVIDDQNSAHYAMFIGKTNRSGVYLIMKSAFQIYYSPNAIAKLMFVNQIYAPMILEMPEGAPFITGSEKRYLCLVGFSRKDQYSGNFDKAVKIVELIYANVNESIGFIDKMKQEEFFDNYKDGWLPKSDFDLTKAEKFDKRANEIITMTFNEEYLKLHHKNNRKQIRKKLIIKKKRHL